MTDRRTFLGGLAATGVMAAPLRAATSGEPVRLAVAAAAAGAPLDHFWSRCVGAGRAAEGLRADWQEQLAQVHRACGFRYLRFHGLFHDDMFVYHETNGRPDYNWQYVDALFDRLLAIGVRPFVEFGFVPKAMASGDNTTFWWKGNTSPPKDYGRWADLVTAAVRHWTARYGLAEVRSWYFEVWNEPDLHGFWSGTRSQYFELYKVTALAVKAVDATLRVGGPATSNFVGDARFDGEVEDKTKHRTNTVEDLSTLQWRGVWIEAFLRYAADNGLPVDFVSTHPYPTDFALNPGGTGNRGRTRSVDSTRDDLVWLQKTVRGSAYPKAEIHCTEWSSSPSSRDAMHDALPAAAYILKANLDSIGLADSLSYWTFTDIFEEGGGGPSIFHGGFGMMNFQGVVKPAYHAYRMLNALGDRLVSRRDGMVVTRHSTTGRITALAYNYPVEVTSAPGFGDTAVDALIKAGSARAFALDLADVAPSARFRIETLDVAHGNATAAWKAIGKPEPPTREQTAVLKRAALAVAIRESRSTGRRFAWSARMATWTCVLIDQTQ